MGLNTRRGLYAGGVDLREVAAHALPQGTAVVYTRCSPLKDSGNEDAAAVLQVGDGAAVLAVADGLGGLPGGAAAAGRLVEAIADSVADVAPDRLREAVLDGIERANTAILEGGSGGGATVAVAQIRGNRVRTYHVGDAGVLVTGQRGRRRLQTVPHSPVGYAQEAGLLDESEALDHEDRNLVSNMVGSHDLRIEVGSSLELAPRDTLVLASDGLFDNWLTAEIVERVRRGDLARAAEHLAEETLDRMEGVADGPRGGHADDLTFILYRRRTRG